MADLINGVERQTHSFASGDTDKNGNTTALDEANCVPEVHLRYSSGSANFDDRFMFNVIMNTSDYDIQRNGTGTAVTVIVDIVEWDPAQTNVQNVSFSTTTTENNSITITSATAANGFVICHAEHTNSGASKLENRMHSFWQDSATTVDFRTDKDTSCTGRCYVVTATGGGFTSEHVAGSMSTTPSVTVGVTTVTEARARLIASAWSDQSQNDLHKSAVTAYLADDSNVIASRATGDAGITNDVEFQLILFAVDQANVQRVTSSDATASVSISFSAVTLSNTIFQCPIHLLGGSSDATSSAQVDSGYVTIVSTSTTAGTFNRGDSASGRATRVDVEIIQVKDTGGGSPFAVACVDAVNFADVVGEVGTFPESSTDNASFADVAAGVLQGTAFAVACVDTVNLADVAAEVGTFPESVVDVVNLADLVAEFATFPESVVDAVAFADVVAGNIVGAGIAVFCVDTVSFADATEPTPRILSKSELTKRILELEDLWLLHVEDAFEEDIP